MENTKFVSDTEAAAFLKVHVRTIRRLIEQVNETSREEQKKWHGGEQDIEGDRTGQKKDVVFAAIVPDSLRVVAKQPTQPGS